MPITEYKCPNCGGSIEWNPGAQEVVCPFCDSVINAQAFSYADSDAAGGQDAGGVLEGRSYEGSGWGEGEQQGLVVFSCSSCGGEIIGEQTMGATTCPFCANPVVVTSIFTGELRPDMVIPFKLRREDALASLERHYANKRLLPESFKQRNHIEEVKGIYVPFWLYDTDTDAHIEYRGQKVRTWSDSRYIYTETSHYQIIREGTLGFNAIPADGSAKIDDTMMESIEPFDLQETVQFSTAYLAGFYANKYDYNSEQCSPRVRERATNSTVSEFRKTVTGYSGVRAVSTNIKVFCSRIHYALLPVWMLGSTWEGMNFIFAMNGQTGKFTGDLPLDKKKKWRLFWIMFAIIAAALLIFTQAYVMFYMMPEDPLQAHIVTAFTSIVLALGVPLIIVTVWTNRLKTVRPENYAGSYIRNGSFKLRTQRDIFLYRNVTKVAKPQNNTRR